MPVPLSYRFRMGSRIKEDASRSQIPREPNEVIVLWAQERRQLRVRGGAGRVDSGLAGMTAARAAGRELTARQPVAKMTRCGGSSRPLTSIEGAQTLARFTRHELKQDQLRT